MEINLEQVNLVTVIFVFIVLERIARYVMFAINLFRPKSQTAHYPPCSHLTEFEKKYNTDTEVRHTKELELQEKLGNMWADIKVIAKSVKYLESRVRNGKKTNTD